MNVESISMMVDYGVIGLLAVMGLWALAVIFERIIYLSRVKIEEFQDAKLLEKFLTRRLVVLATVAANAPYIGLLGTVLGIMLTFYQMGESGQMEVKEIMLGLSLALKATAMGLLVAIPSVISHNLLRRWVRELLLDFESSYGK